MNLVNLSPDIQEAILFFLRTGRCRRSITPPELQAIAAVTD